MVFLGSECFFLIVDDKTVEPNQVIQKQVLTFTVEEKKQQKKIK